MPGATDGGALEWWSTLTEETRDCTTVLPSLALTHPLSSSRAPQSHRHTHCPCQSVRSSSHVHCLSHTLHTAHTCSAYLNLITHSYTPDFHCTLSLLTLPHLPTVHLPLPSLALTHPHTSAVHLTLPLENGHLRHSVNSRHARRLPRSLAATCHRPIGCRCCACGCPCACLSIPLPCLAHVHVVRGSGGDQSACRGQWREEGGEEG